EGASPASWRFPALHPLATGEAEKGCGPPRPPEKPRRRAAQRWLKQVCRARRPLYYRGEFEIPPLSPGNSMSALFSPIRLGSVELANRIHVAPMCQYSADDGSATDWHLGHLAMLANSGAAMVVVEATHVERHGRITHGCMGLYSDHNEAALARVI